jgi:hypothetical protein
VRVIIATQHLERRVKVRGTSTRVYRAVCFFPPVAVKLSQAVLTGFVASRSCYRIGICRLGMWCVGHSQSSKDRDKDGVGS